MKMNETKTKKTIQRRYIFAAGLFLLLICTICLYIVLTFEPEPDPASEMIIRQIVATKLNKELNDLTEEDFAGIKELEVSTGYIGTENPKLKDIKILEKFTNLEYFGIVYVHFQRKEVSKVFSFLAKIGIYDLDAKHSIDLSPLEKLKKLKNLKLFYTNISSIKSIRKLKNLEELGLAGTQVSDLKPINQMKNLKNLIIENSPVSDLNPIKGLTNLEELYLMGTKVSNLEPLRKLTKMRVLELPNNPVSDISPLADMNNLRSLSLNGTNVSNLDLLKKFKNLKILNLGNCPNITKWQKDDLQKALPELKELFR